MWLLKSTFRTHCTVWKNCMKNNLVKTIYCPVPQIHKYLNVMNINYKHSKVINISKQAISHAVSFIFWMIRTNVCLTQSHAFTLSMVSDASTSSVIVLPVRVLTSRHRRKRAERSAEAVPSWDLDEDLHGCCKAREVLEPIPQQKHIYKKYKNNSKIDISITYV